MKENMAPDKKFNAVERAHRSQCEKQLNKGKNRKNLRCCTCGGEHHRRYFPSHKGGRHQIYSSQEAQIVGDVGQSIPQFYATMDNRLGDCNNPT